MCLDWEGARGPEGPADELNTQGETERSYRTPCRFVRKQLLAATLEQSQEQIDAFDRICNTERPHQVLRQAVIAGASYGRPDRQVLLDRQPIAGPQLPGDDQALDTLNDCGRLRQDGVVRLDVRLAHVHIADMEANRRLSLKRRRQQASIWFGWIEAPLARVRCDVSGHR